MILNLDDIKRFSFPGGERHVVFDAKHSLEAVRAVIRNSDDLLDLMLLTDLLKRQNAEPSTLILPYIPYARQDRQTTDDSPFSLQIAANLINSLEYDVVWVYEPHSDVAPALIKNVKVESFDVAAYSFLQYVTSIEQPKEQPDNRVILAPDVGAVKRVDKFIKYLYNKRPYKLAQAVALKDRDPSTGHVTIKGVYGDIKDKDVIILDDICDGGATFNQLAEYIRSTTQVRTISLFVAHGIFSKGLDELRKNFKHIGTTDSYYKGPEDDLLVLNSI